MESEVYITGANKRVNRVFQSVGEAEKYISERSLEPEYGRDSIVLKEINYHKLKIEKTSSLSDFNKDKLIDEIKVCISTNSAIIDNLNGLRFLYSKYKKNHTDPLTKLQRVYLDNYYIKDLEDNGISEEDIISHVNGNIYSSDSLKMTGKLVDVSKSSFLENYLKPLVDNSKSDDFDFIYVQTNYKPCNSITLFHKETQLNFQIRNKDLVISYFDVYGRNVAVIKKVNCTDDHLKNIFIMSAE